MGRNDTHRIAQQQLQRTLATGFPILDFVDSNPIEMVNANQERYQVNLLKSDTEVHVGNRVIDVLFQTRDESRVDGSYALEVIDTSPPEYGAIINHLRSGYSVALLYIQRDTRKRTVNNELVDAIETGLTIDDFAPGWIKIGEEACLGTVVSLTNTTYAIKSWANELAPRLNSQYTWTFRETVVPDIPVDHPVTCVGKFDIVNPDCIDDLGTGIYTGFHDHTQQDPVVYLVDSNQEFVRLETPELQAIQNTKALTRVTPLPGSTPSF